MIERRPLLDVLAHAILLVGVAVVAFPVYLTLVASTQSAQDIATSRPLSLLPGSHALQTYQAALFGGESSSGSRMPAA